MIERIRQTVAEHPALATIAASAGMIALGAIIKGAIPDKNHDIAGNFDTGENYFDIIARLDTTIRRADENIHYFMLGGGASAALKNKATLYNLERKAMIPPADIEKGQFRADNGTMTDIDLLVFSGDDDVIEKVRSALTPNQHIITNGSDVERIKETRKIGNKLKIGVTGLRTQSEGSKHRASFANSFMKDWVSQRTLNEEGTVSWSIGNVSVELPAEHFEPWYLELKDGEAIPVLHPLIQVACYLGRASHGIRKRDVSKVTEMMDNIGPVFGAHLEWGEKNQTAKIVMTEPVDKGVESAIDFVNVKNQLRWGHTKNELGRVAAAALAAKVAVHRQIDTIPFFVQFGQGGKLYDKVLSRFSGERQQEI
ncbi:MAG: hypothetical protein ABI354_02805 [Candidatus Saccharimonadales bacterium]